jgi:CheY-like chemotaxis protein
MALVLVVDDEPSFRFFLKALFESEGHEVMVGRNAAEGLRHLESRKPALITLDVMMPGHGGLKMYREMKSREAWRDIPVIMLSGVKAGTYAHALAMSGSAGEALPGPFAYVEKPPLPEQLLELARTILGPPSGPGSDADKP